MSLWLGCAAGTAPGQADTPVPTESLERPTEISGGAGPGWNGPLQPPAYSRQPLTLTHANHPTRTAYVISGQLPNALNLVMTQNVGKARKISLDYEAVFCDDYLTIIYFRLPQE